MTDSIILFTDSFPYGKAESFLETEILFLSKKFRRVVIIPNAPTGNTRPLPGNCEVLICDVKLKKERKIRFVFFENIFKVAGYYLFLLIHSSQRWYYLTNLISVLAELSMIVDESKRYYAVCKDHLSESNLLYFYWFRRPLIHFSILKAEGRIGHRIVSRAHGWDFDPERNPLGFHPYREIELKQVDNLVVISRWGAELLKRTYPQFAQKITHSYLGVNDSGQVISERQAGDFHIISCSTVWEIKRLDRIVEILRHIPFEVKWTHIGEGPLMEDIKKQAMALPVNVKCEFLGAQSNAFVLEYYSKVHCDLFVNVSRKEGLPVSLMEAISFGIPVMGTDVGGVSEIVNQQTGFLLHRDFNSEKAAAIIADYHESSDDAKVKLRNSARNYFLNSFKADVNYTDFINDHLLK